MLLYEFHAEPDDNQTFLITSDMFPEVVTFAETADECAHRAMEAIEEAIGARIAAGEDVPAALDAASVPPSTFLTRIGLQASIKLLLYWALRAAGITRAELARRLGWHREQVDRLFRLDHASRCDQFDAAFSALGHRLNIALSKAA